MCVCRHISSENSTRETVLSSHLMGSRDRALDRFDPTPTWQLIAILTPALSGLLRCQACMWCSYLPAKHPYPYIVV